MADVRPFRGVGFDPARAGLTRVLCPPYDVISSKDARRFRRASENAIHVELPEGNGAAKYRKAAKTWKKWRKSGLLLQDGQPSFYVSEERFVSGGRSRRRLGFLAALGVTPAAAKFVVRHERTLSKPKADRARLLKAVRANTSPIFGIFPDPSGAVRRELAKAAARKPAATGRLGPVAYRLWKLSDPRAVAAVRRALAPRKILIADGHHRYEVGRRHYAATRAAEASAILAYLCPEEDQGLVVLPTHRIVREGNLSERAKPDCRVRSCGSLSGLLTKLSASRNPYSFGLCNGRFFLAEPRNPAGCRSGLCVEWLGRRLLAEVPPDQISYTPDAKRAVALARKERGAAVLVKPFRVAQIRTAVSAVGLLPPKSTYFYPKVATGLVFKSLERPARP